MSDFAEGLDHALDFLHVLEGPVRSIWDGGLGAALDGAPDGAVVFEIGMTKVAAVRVDGSAVGHRAIRADMVRFQAGDFTLVAVIFPGELNEFHLYQTSNTVAEAEERLALTAARWPMRGEPTYPEASPTKG